MDTDKPGTDWSAKHAAAGTQAATVHESYTVADGSRVEQHAHPMTDAQILDMVEGTGR